MQKKNKKVPLTPKPILVLSRKTIAGWVAAILLVCAWMFVIGVLVGRDTSPLKIDISELQKKLQTARETLNQKKQHQAREQSGASKDKTELGFYEVLKKNRVDTEIPEVLRSPKIEKEKDTPPAEKLSLKKKVSLKRLTRSQPKVATTTQTPQKGAGAKSKPQPSAPKGETIPAGKPYAIQVAAFKAVGDADHLVAELKKKGFAAYRKITKISGRGIWYQVRVGVYHNKAAASQTIANLKRKGLKPILVAK